jgi:hypothetical protein
MALTAIEKKQLRRVTKANTSGLSADDADTYLDSVGADDVFARAEIAAYKAKMLPQLTVDLAVNTARKQDKQKQIDLLNS